ncbi:MAG: hypothetical protein A2268_13210 [Candidatus Raymondbacteria bacterium RifOxyA12_full_50_37]|uniref:PIN domain-containing protein n=1 Tax=Candidatus Raymondbacteria bacterium RIFOXYD12_FULL_49_13 TaxID=1817890 RepID=A0A1F7EZW6_UNCRA|nr:MAG: hypothetical protein A2268_13210 [Candidatus Raymondbacteria bacterium RifOxyA12_full_50_37]OGJ93020.1 MAG: hypothetical protein A2248_18345 [Candidatus Raymondbacteria bacterium RIFOXYA2_FULL_49_16]OGJ93588.1 MAG: hypothetical protein A2350_19080 [Candidatus Raymondbacteria bacterium RifOxyB12_full_50_8]OGJ99933.1 MAG: hypothetical protein A2519_00325 [Candidatus Raymondbacteria bacterium RIFOXYD12_FULL_49_13]OGK01557.1 MAG: hypothetical protein A2487_15555 [Candidatus Raymondbacteria 
MSSKPCQNLDHVPKSDIVLVDANICIYAINGGSPQCEQFLARCAQGEVAGIMPCHVLAEVMHQLMMAEARDYQWIKGPNPAHQLSAMPDRVRALSRYKELVRDILGLGIQTEPVIQEDFIAALAIQSQAGLLTNDALIVAVAERLRIHSIASADKGFSGVTGIVLYSPDDIK